MKTTRKSFAAALAVLALVPCLAAQDLKPDTTEPMGQKFQNPKPAGTLRVLLVGAGGSHDFPRYFLGKDAETLRAAGKIDTAATPNLEEAKELLEQADVFVFSANHGTFGLPPFQQRLNAFADAGKGIVLLHAATWYNWPEETGYNKRFVGGGSRGHGFKDFEVKVKKPNHPVMKGVPKTFSIFDENYYIELMEDAKVEVLAENEADDRTNKPHPSVWIVKDRKTRIVCISLGHDARAHDNEAYKTLLVNAVKWVSEKR